MSVEAPKNILMINGIAGTRHNVDLARASHIDHSQWTDIDFCQGIQNPGDMWQTADNVAVLGGDGSGVSAMLQYLHTEGYNPNLVLHLLMGGTQGALPEAYGRHPHVNERLVGGEPAYIHRQLEAIEQGRCSIKKVTPGEITEGSIWRRNDPNRESVKYPVWYLGHGSTYKLLKRIEDLRSEPVRDRKLAGSLALIKDVFLGKSMVTATVNGQQTRARELNIFFRNNPHEFGMVHLPQGNEALMMYSGEEGENILRTAGLVTLAVLFRHSTLAGQQLIKTKPLPANAMVTMQQDNPEVSDGVYPWVLGSELYEGDQTIRMAVETRRRNHAVNIGTL